MLASAAVSVGHAVHAGRGVVRYAQHLALWCLRVSFHATTIRALLLRLLEATLSVSPSRLSTCFTPGASYESATTSP